ncbi:MAG TPA: mechanosensitive ion channel family protein [Firmicutes bacterium]|nr:mechanosensitive ion channel family protein [Bacillota bacterium]
MFTWMDALPKWVPVARLQEMAFNASKGALRIVVIIVLAIILVRLSGTMIETVLSRARGAQNGKKPYFDERKLKTLEPLLKSVARYVIYFFAGVAIIGEFGIDTTSLLAGAGLAGLAVGFGAQNLVRDVINGFFILFEDQFGVGDYVAINDVSGIVEDMGLRVTRVRDFGGQLHIIPNSQISKVTNFMGAAMRVLFEVGIAYETDVERALKLLSEDFEKAKVEIEGIVEGPTVLGVSDFADSAIKLMIIAKTKPMEQWRVERELKLRIKQLFDREGIGIPYPHHHVILERDPREAHAGDLKD